MRPRHALYLPAPHPAPSALAHAWSLSMVLLGLTPQHPAAFVHSPECLNCSKAGKQEVPSTKGFQQAEWVTSHCLPPGLFLQQTCAHPQSHCSTREELLTDTGTHRSTHRAVNSEQVFLLHPHSPTIYMMLRLFLPLILLWTTVHTHSEWRCSGYDCRAPPAYPLSFLSYMLLNHQTSQLY